jgi:hypothetical protein
MARFFSYSIAFLLSLFIEIDSATADSGAMYEAWEEGEATITEKGNLITDSFYFSDNGEPPPPPPPPRWGSFRSVQEYGGPPVDESVYKGNAPQENLPPYQPNADPFANRLDHIENLLSQ